MRLAQCIVAGLTLGCLAVSASAAVSLELTNTAQPASGTDWQVSVVDAKHGGLQHDYQFVGADSGNDRIWNEENSSNVTAMKGMPVVEVAYQLSSGPAVAGQWVNVTCGDLPMKLTKRMHIMIDSNNNNCSIQQY